MSQGAFNQFLSQSIIARAREELLKLKNSQLVTIDGNLKFSDRSPLSISNIRDSTNKVSSGYQSIVTRQGLVNLAEEFTNTLNDNAMASKAANLLSSDTLFNNFRDFIKEEYAGNSIKNTRTKAYYYETIQASNGDIRVGTSNTDQDEDLIIFKNLNHGDLKPLFIKFLNSTCNDVELIKFIQQNLDAGYISGIFNIMLQRLFNLQVKTSDSPTYREFTVTSSNDTDLSSTFNSILLLLNDADYISSNISYDINLATSVHKDLYSKDGPKASVELQLSLANQKFGRALSHVGLQLNNLIIAVDSSKARIDTVGARQATTKLIQSLKTIAKLVIDTSDKLLKTTLSEDVANKMRSILYDTTTVLKLIETPGSDTIIDSIGNTVANTLAGKSNIPIQTTTAHKSTTVQTKSSGVKKTPDIKVKSNTSTTKFNFPLIKTLQNRSYTLASLQVLLNTHLQDVISANMGRGNDKSILNYRTGRFASTVKVDRLSLSREGMITAFYSYMKNPYQTFEPGFKQGLPKSRNPRLLIAKSIREIAAIKVGNRLRSVLI
jgi:hypothetical protein